jgi:formylglycine-generating enzyme required for sulfatase activity
VRASCSLATREQDARTTYYGQLTGFDMSYCLNPNCQKPQNPPAIEFCQTCGAKLLLRERYRAVKTIGQGGFGKTYLAVDEDKPSTTACVIKQFYLQQQDTDNFEKAAELFTQEAVRLNELGTHPQIPELLAHFTEDDRQYLVQPFVEGQNLAEILAAEGPFNEAKIRHLLSSLLPVLEFIHSRQVIHRDIKPANIIQASNQQLVLVDFGAAKYTTSTALMKTGTVIGTAEYIAPEQTRGKAIFASDLYSLGVTCIHLLTQFSPFDLFDVGEDNWIWRQFLVDNPISDELGKILDRLIANGINRRYQSASEVLTTLNYSSIETLSSKISTPNRSSAKNIVTSTPNLVNLSTPTLPLQAFEFEVVTLRVRKQGFLGVKLNIETSSIHQQAEFFAEDLSEGIILEMVAIPGGTFMMGSPGTERGRFDDEGPQHQVNIAPFSIGKYPITQEQYEVVMGQNPSKFKGEKRPIELVSWHDANEFCDRLSQKTGRKYRLPSEAEWEYACRAGTTTPFYFGETIATDIANYDGKYTYGSASKGIDRQQTTDVGSFPPNNFGLYDLHGNVSEWCADIGHKNYKKAPIDGSIWESGGDDKYRMIRGGSWDDSPWYCRSAARVRGGPDIRREYVGFRVVLSGLETD